MKFEWQKAVRAIAPALATALGSPIAGVATGIILDSLGLPKDSNDEAIANAIQTGGADALLKIKEADNKFATDMERIGYDYYKADVDDRANARNLGVQRGLAIQALLSLVFVIGYFLVMYVVFEAAFNGVNIEQAFLALISTLLGIMTTSVAQIINYWFGSSAGSRAKDAFSAVKGIVK